MALAFNSTTSIDKTLEKDASVTSGFRSTVAATQVDVAAELTAGKQISFTPEQAARLRRKIDLHLMPLMCILYIMQFADKSTLGQSAVLGIFQGTNIVQSQFNWLSTVFYLFFLGFEWPQNLALQYFPVGKWMSFNVFVWAVALLCHAATTSFGGLFACRVFLGICEGAITPGFLLVTAMFYTRKEQSQRVGYWFLMNGVAIILLGLIAYGVLHIKSTHLMPWQWLMIIFGSITLVVSVIFWFFFPDSPTSAWFLTPEERMIAIERIKVNQAGLENKHFKREQFIECLRDPKTWLFFLMSAICNVTNSLSNQRQIIVSGFGFDTGETTLLGTVDGAVEVIVIFCTVTSATYWKNGRAYSAALASLVALLGSILVNVLPNHRVALLFCYWISISFIASFVVILGWSTAVTAGHTKRTTTNAIVMIGYALGNAVGPQFWKKSYQPRNHIPWAILSACWLATAVLILGTRMYLARENRLRDREEHDATYDEVHIAHLREDGSEEQLRVDKEFLDLTDIQNRDFRYVL